ncbi:hypothetical protein KKF84_05495 [Myxococcota bacterium]|nr:hypothetical protein [Myxococcota bacterium]
MIIPVLDVSGRLVPLLPRLLVFSLGFQGGSELFRVELHLFHVLAGSFLSEQVVTIGRAVPETEPGRCIE